MIILDTALEERERQGRPVRVGLQLAGRRIAREGAAVFAGETRIGEVTSGTFSPTLEQAIALIAAKIEAGGGKKKAPAKKAAPKKPAAKKAPAKKAAPKKTVKAEDVPF